MVHIWSDFLMTFRLQDTLQGTTLHPHTTILHRQATHPITHPLQGIHHMGVTLQPTLHLLVPTLPHLQVPTHHPMAIPLVATILLHLEASTLPVATTHHLVGLEWHLLHHSQSHKNLNQKSQNQSQNQSQSLVCCYTCYY